MAQLIEINGYKFWGYYTLGDNMKNEPAVYVIFDGQGDKFVDVGQTGDLNDRPKNHDRKPCWIENCPNGIYFAARLEPDEKARSLIEQSIRNNYANMPCGER